MHVKFTLFSVWYVFLNLLVFLRSSHSYLGHLISDFRSLSVFVLIYFFIILLMLFVIVSTVSSIVSFIVQSVLSISVCILVMFILL